MQEYLSPTWFVESDHAAVIEYARETVGDATDHPEMARRLFLAVRDDIRYSAYGIRWERESFRASHVLKQRRGWCVTKSCLLAAVSRAVGVPCRLGYGDVRNHVATKKLLDAIGTDIFYYHGYNEFFLDGRWIKATVAFNRSLCEKAGLVPLEFDGENDSLYHPYDIEGRRHMEYLHDYGPEADIPYEAIIAKFCEVYLNFVVARPGAAKLDGDFEAEVAAETAQKQRS